MSDAEANLAPLADVRALIRNSPAPAAEPGQKVREALLTMGREGDFGRLGQAAEWLATWQNRYPPRIETPVLAVFAGSHGIVEEGVSMSSNRDTRAHVDALREGRAPMVPGRAALEVHRLIAALERSGQTGARVSLNEV